MSLLEAIDPNDKAWHDWPLTATDGDCATLIELVSDDKVSLFFTGCSHCRGANTDFKVDFTIDTSLPQSARPALDWNSKKAGESQKSLPGT